MGEAARGSTKKNKNKKLQPTVKLPSTKGCAQPRFTDSMSPLTTPPSPRVTTSAPGQSTWPPTEVRLSGIYQSEIVMTAAARGRLMKNTQRQEACSTSQPPRTGPMAVVIAVNPDHVPIA